MKAIQELKGQRLFQYIGDDGERHPVESHDINEYLHEIVGEHFTAKDFRTWAGTIAAAKALSMHPAPQTEREAKKTVTLCVKATAAALPAGARIAHSSYIHPGVLRAFTEQKLPETFAHAEGEEYEGAVLEFLDALTAEVEEETGLTAEEQVEVSAA